MSEIEHKIGRLVGFGPNEAEARGREIIASLENEGYVVVAPYQRVVYHGEGADEEYQLVPTRQIETYLQAIEMLKARK